MADGRLCACHSVCLQEPPSSAEGLEGQDRLGGGQVFQASR